LACACLAALGRLRAAEMRRAGGDAVAFLVALAADCFRGRLPLSFLASLVEGLRRAREGEWSSGALARLQVLLAQEAFLADVALDDWLALGRAYPGLGTVLGLANRWQWLQRYALWAEHNRRPWAEVAPALTVYDLAGRADQEEFFDTYPDLLLHAPTHGVTVGTRGVWFQGI